LSDERIRLSPIFLLSILIDKYTAIKKEMKFVSASCSGEIRIRQGDQPWRRNEGRQQEFGEQSESFSSCLKSSFPSSSGRVNHGAPP